MEAEEGAAAAVAFLGGSAAILWTFAPFFVIDLDFRGICVMQFRSKFFTGRDFFTAQLEPSLMVFFRLKLRPDLPSQFLGKGSSSGHWQVFDHHDFFLAPNCAHFLPHKVTSVSSMDAVSGEPRMPATCFTKASSTAKNNSMDGEDMAIIGTQI